MFGDVPGIDYLTQWIPYVIGAVVLVIAFTVLWGPIVKRNVRQQTFTGITVQDIDKMRREGLISEDEYKLIKHKAAERELDSMRQQTNADRERQILAEAVINPEAARKLLPPDAAPETKPRPLQQPAPAPPAPAAPESAPAPQATSDLFNWGDPLAGIDIVKEAPAPPDGGVTRPHPGKIKVPPPQGFAPAPQAAPAPEPAGELEILLQKGAITREDYERLKSLIKK
ncbi:MAG: hypothetical protein ABFD69_09405 [Candidatus Sumerlaeia bacterium]